jgi:hypothetical protein
MIEEKVMEDIEMRGKIHESLEKRSPRKRTALQCLMSAEAVEVSWIMSKSPRVHMMTDPLKSLLQMADGKW